MEDSQATTPTPDVGKPRPEADTITRVFGNDMWMRFDMWAGRAWETAQKAMDLVEQSPPPMNSDDVVYDPRVGALYHAAGIAQEFADKVNPMAILGAADYDMVYDTGPLTEIVVDTITENEELD